MTEAIMQKGFTALPNSILKILMSSFTIAETRILLTIARYTYGYNRDRASLPLAFISSEVGISKTNVAKSVRSLINRKIITVYSKATYTRSKVIGINPDLSQWVDVKNIKLIE